MSAKKKQVSLAEKISNLVTPIPTSYESDDEAEETKAKVVEFDDEDGDAEVLKTEFSSSNLRKRNVGLLEDADKRYAGKKVSKKKIFNQDESSEGSEEEADDDDADGSEENTEEILNEKSGSEEDDESLDDVEEGSDEEESDGGVASLQENDDDDDDDDDDHDDDDDDEFGDSIDLSNPLRRSRDQNGIQTMSATNIRAEVEKGNCVREQLKLWENLLEMRIKLQKCLVNSNKMPQYDIYKDYETGSDFKKGCGETKQKLTGLLSNLLKLQTNLLSNFPETKGILRKGENRKSNEDGNESEEEEGEEEEEEGSMDEEIPSDTDDEMNVKEEDEDNEEEESEESDKEEKKGPPKKKIRLSEFENIISKNHKAYKDYRNSVIQKWNDKTRIAAGVISKGANQPAVKQIEFALANKDKLIKKTQLKRSEYDIIGKEPITLDDNDGRRTQEYDTEIYDDDDFYHQLLRELIEHKSADITDPIQLSKQWIMLQNMRSKMKRKIDTRATKGRRLRYNVHQKLVNFMAPITTNDTWTDHAKDELYRSLFGTKKAATEEPKTATAAAAARINIVKSI